MQKYLRTGASPGGSPVRVFIPPGACRRVWAVASAGVTGVVLTQLQDGDGSLVGTVPQTYAAATGDLNRLVTTGAPLADDRAQLEVTLQGAPGSVCDLIIDDGCGCGR